MRIIKHFLNAHGFPKSTGLSVLLFSVVWMMSLYLTQAYWAIGGYTQIPTPSKTIKHPWRTGWNSSFRTSLISSHSKEPFVFSLSMQLFIWSLQIRPELCNANTSFSNSINSTVHQDSQPFHCHLNWGASRRVSTRNGLSSPLGAVSPSLDCRSWWESPKQLIMLPEERCR